MAFMRRLSRNTGILIALEPSGFVQVSVWFGRLKTLHSAQNVYLYDSVGSSS